jgi:hypothetical protein
VCQSESGKVGVLLTIEPLLLLVHDNFGAALLAAAVWTKLFSKSCSWLTQSTCSLGGRAS